MDEHIDYIINQNDKLIRNNFDLVLILTLSYNDDPFYYDNKSITLFGLTEILEILKALVKYEKNEFK